MEVNPVSLNSVSTVKSAERTDSACKNSTSVIFVCFCYGEWLEGKQIWHHPPSADLALAGTDENTINSDPVRMKECFSA